MKKGIFAVVFTLSVFLLVSCGSISGGVGYGGSTYIQNGTDYKSQINGFSTTATVVFDFNKEDPGFCLFLRSHSIFKGFTKEDITRYSLSLGPSYEIRTNGRFEVLVGMGLAIGGYYLTQRDRYDQTTSISDSSTGLEAIAEARYYISSRDYIGFEGVFDYNFSDKITVSRESSYTAEGHGTGFNVALKVGHSF